MAQTSRFIAICQSVKVWFGTHPPHTDHVGIVAVIQQDWSGHDLGQCWGKRTRVAIQIPQSYNVESELIESLPIGNRAGRVDFL